MSNYNTQLQSIGEDLQQVIQTLQNKATGGGEQAAPEIFINNNTGLITAIAGTKSSTYQLAFQPAKTITPSATSQIAVSSGYYTGGNITVASVPTQTKSITPKATTQNVTPDSGKFFSKITVEGDSNLVAENIKSGVSIFGVSGTLEEGGASSGEQVEWSANEDAMVTGTLSNYFNDRATKIGICAFYSCTSLTTVSFPVCKSIDRYAFYSCTGLTTVSFPVCTNFGKFAFAYCSRLTTVSFPVCTSIGDNAFYSCSLLTSISFPACTNIGSNAFAYCSRLTTVSFPVCTSIGSYAFDGTGLTTVSFPVCTNIGKYAFDSCSRLTSISFPACTNIGSYAFQYCTSLTIVSFPVCTQIYSSAFRGCYNLSSIALGASTICTLSNSNAFSSTPFVGYRASFSGTPHIYVPASLIDAYKSATNWVYFSSYFSSIESLGDNLITFTVNGKEYQAEKGMTWEEWVESEYNTNYFNISGTRVCNFSGDAINSVIKTDLIIEAAYST